MDDPVETLYSPAAMLRVRPRTEGAYRRTMNVVYAEAHGVGLVMDVFAPRDGAGGPGVVDVVSGAWHSDRVRLNEHIGLGVFDAFCARGLTVFAVRPGSAGAFTARQMVRHVHAAIRHVKAHAGDYGVDPSRVGITGASAGGHLAALAALRPEPPHPASRHVWRQAGSAVRAAALFFPPTDFLDYGGRPFDFELAEGLRIDRLLFEDGLRNHTEAEIAAEAAHLSPARHAGPGAPPFLLVHGDADPVVPVSQSRALAAALRAAGGEAEVIVKPGGLHPWPDIRVEIDRAAAWMAARLGG